jgi:uncharacterized membrane protein YqjE
MMHPLLHLITTQPQLLADHAEAYADLLGEEIGTASAVWKRRVVLNALALCGLGVAAVLGGVALMLWAVIPPADIQAPWALVVAPLLPLLGAVACVVAARSEVRTGAFETVRRQVKADVAMLREVSAS